ncbi:YtxH domain-containing protein [Candidatus Curtissbacteria bacterium]|nr:YtxH domain-containing protein [Candidatus Curtissbacteria bacterium]
MSDQNKDNSLTALVAGIILGAAVTYLFTTKDGQKVKDKLLVEGSKLLDKLKEGLENVGEEIEEKAGEIVESAGEIRDAAATHFEEAKENVQDALREVPPQVAEIQKKGRKFFFRRHQSSSES